MAKESNVHLVCIFKPYFWLIRTEMSALKMKRCKKNFRGR